MNKKILKITIAVSIIFISGMVIGAAGTGCFLKSRFDKMRHGCSEEREDHMMRILCWKLKLNDQQKVHIRPIVRKAGNDLHSLRAQLEPEIMSILDGCYTDISAELTDKQKLKFQNLHQKVKSHWTLKKQ